MSVAKQRQPKFTSPVFQAGDHVPLAILIMENNGKVVNYHLPQKLYALKNFSQAEMMQHYFYQHPQQPVYLDQTNPDIGGFNASITNLHKWLILNGYARQEGKANLTVHIWTEEEMNAAREEIKAQRLAHAEAMAALDDMESDMTISQGINNLLGGAEAVTELGTKLYAEGSLGKEQHAPVNVGTIGHVDHGKSALASMVDRATPAEPTEAGIPESYLEQQVGQLGIPGSNISYDPAAVEATVAEMQERTPQYPAIDAPADLMEPQSVKGE